MGQITIELFMPSLLNLCITKVQIQVYEICQKKNVCRSIARKDSAT